MNKILELFGKSTAEETVNWEKIVKKQECPYTLSRCFKVRKSTPDISIGTCVLLYGKEEKEVIICPYRLLQNRQVFTDAIHLLTLHEPGNEFHVIPEVAVPGGSVDYFLVSAKKRKVMDFVAVEFQTLDTTGTVWPERQRFLKEKGLIWDNRDSNSSKSFGMNWKMTAKTILVQLYHKIETIEYLNKHLVLVLQDFLLDYMRKEFSFNHLDGRGKIGDSMHFHSYSFVNTKNHHSLNLNERLSTDSTGMAKCLGLQAESKVGLSEMIEYLELKISDKTLLRIA